MKILQINASARSEGANSTRLADAVTARLKALNPGADVEVRDLARNPHPIIDEAALGALFTPAADRTPEQAARVALDDAMIAQLQSADAIVLGVPMYNFGTPVQLKAWVDAIARAGVTFRYTESGPEGLVKGKKVYVALARGGRYRGTDADAQVPWLKTVLGFLGMTDIEFVYAEGLAMGEDSTTRAFAEAQEQIDALAA
ncbi:FMN-dependent NADH-azoreductase [Quisquiliibacterium transsilvanicum]|uniref:FMN dependent NADH:quinone oxidoreductase n=1 Tax=Quisquiliibacterium transsilvanicum TaxID=1549638 RepID=A0A7W8M958_9BURK|nr:NAD(P)H-dependent oxidoreductase [Quisquiliibacterium transsilvanicum]MBB5272518.1 FMN-dependent NADH-azoreductase [Quisquiliibacterium transsilvanicum]